MHQHLSVKAAVGEVTDIGEFSALAATWSKDRAGERIVRGAFAGTTARWQQSGKQLPLALEPREQGT